MISEDAFRYHDGELFVEDVSLRKLAEEFGTPLYVYSKRTMVSALAAYHDAFHRFNPLICYAVKANSNLEIIRTLAERGAGADIVSGGELFRAIKANVPSQKIVFAGVGKTKEEIRFALNENILMFNVESAPELELISRVAKEAGKVAPIAFRVNPDVDPLTHPYISTGLKKYKFGIPLEDAPELYRRAAQDRHVKALGFQMHIGSQLTDITPYRDSLVKAVDLIKKLRREDIDLRYLDIGGGLGIRYNDEEVPTQGEMAELLEPLLLESRCQLILEPGRSIVGNAGVLLTETLYHKQTAEKSFLIVDAAMNDLARPSLYGAYHYMLPVRQTSAEVRVFDVVGPICESGDFLAKDRELPLMDSGDLLAVLGAGAYGFTMSSNYNSRRRAAEVLVDSTRYSLIRKRETYDELIQGEL